MPTCQIHTISRARVGDCAHSWKPRYHEPWFSKGTTEQPHKVRSQTSSHLVYTEAAEAALLLPAFPSQRPCEDSWQGGAILSLWVRCWVHVRCCLLRFCGILLPAQSQEMKLQRKTCKGCRMSWKRRIENLASLQEGCWHAAANSCIWSQGELWEGQHVLSEDPDTAGTGNGTESDGETSKGGGAYWSSQDSKAQRSQSATS